jgi:hypothetical protein
MESGEGGGGRCKRHPGVRAGWRCRGCAAALCPDCVVGQQLNGARFVSCVLCGAAADVLTRHRKDVAPLAVRLLDAPAFPFKRSVFTSLIAVAAFMAFLGWLVSLPGISMGRAIVWGVRLGIFWSYMFYIVRITADGATALGVPDFRDKGDLYWPAAKGMVGTALIWLPPLAWMLATRGFDLSALPELWSSPATWIFAALGVLYAPMALLEAATGAGIVEMLNPVTVVLAISRLGADYWRTVGALAVLLFAGGLIDHLVVPLAQRLPVPLVSGWLASAVGLYVPFVMARALGLLLHLRGDDLDWGNSNDYLQPILRGVEPRGRPHDGPPAPAAPPPAPGGTPSEEIAAALEAQDAPRTIALYGAVREPARLDLTPAQHFAVGWAAASAREFPVAVRALKIPAHSSDEIAGRALLALAQVYAEGLRDPDLAGRLYLDAIKRFPDSEVSRFASQRLSALG